MQNRRRAALTTTDRARRNATIAVVAAFAVSRAGYIAAGLRFQTAQAFSVIHLIDAPVVESEPLRSVWFDHAQPPVFNLLWAGSLRIGGTHPGRVLWPLLLACGLATGVALLRLLLRFGCSPVLAAGMAGAWTVSPTAALVESYPIYTPLEMLGVVLAALALHRWATSGRLPDVAAAVGAAAVLGLTRSTFHLVWIVGVIGLAVAARHLEWRRVVGVASLPLLLVVGWYVHGALLFDSFGVSSWAGGSLSRVTVHQLDPTERERLVTDGTLSIYANFPPFLGLEQMGLPPTGRTDPRTDAAVLNERTSSDPTRPNLHHRDYLDVNDAMLDDATWVVRNRPGTYLRGVARSVTVTYTSSSGWFGYRPNVDHIEGAVVAERMVLGAWDEPSLRFLIIEPRRAGVGEVAWVVVVAHLAALLLVPRRLIRDRAWRTRSPNDVSITFVWATVVFLTLVTVALEFGETNRMRSVSDIGVIAMIGWLLAPREPQEELVGDRAAVDVEDRTGHVAGGVGGEEERRPDHLVG